MPARRAVAVLAVLAAVATAVAAGTLVACGRGDVLSHDPPNRYQLLALADPRHVLILTVEHATLDTAAALLRARGATGEILTFDGGISTYLGQASLGQLVPITNSDGALPHYLCVLAR